ncbi:hypothetical protein Lepto7376_1620 [[Leptolyngbya] sp. PCC 7376]|uniref:antibiotic biosynthesis monooxygenase family protein n=1 Tax=[Leptolyngbya] sp. PCC 7376 TaxID=111781 RepID=UPI00029F3605|nr:antibiotic biosynthesis monooxygenase [[Leptolyngbya] sp. PCC 7376]AFY37956.1 hypothetical protein Lepto7376_1620 [[Leptolyngbya] sp. PCC 7376]
MILRILRAQIFHELRDEFEKGPAIMSVKLVLSQKGCVSCQVTKPLHKTSNTYAMISLWENKESLQAFAGEDFEKAAIPAGMNRYISSCSVEHYISTEPFRPKS